MIIFSKHCSKDLDHKDLANIQVHMYKKPIFINYHL